MLRGEEARLFVRCQQSERKLQAEAYAKDCQVEELKGKLRRCQHKARTLQVEVERGEAVAAYLRIQLGYPS